jgi:hypothetical protein
MADEAVQGVLSEIREEQVSVFLDSGSDIEDRERAHVIIWALNQIDNKFQSIIADELIFDRNEQKRKSGPWQRLKLK